MFFLPFPGRPARQRPPRQPKQLPLWQAVFLEGGTTVTVRVQAETRSEARAKLKEIKTESTRFGLPKGLQLERIPENKNA